MGQGHHPNPHSPNKDSRALFTYNPVQTCSLHPREKEVTVYKPASVNVTPSYLKRRRKKKKKTQSAGPTVGRSIASVLCTQNLTLFREAWQREKSRRLGSSCHQLSWLAPPQLLTSAVVTVSLHTQLQGAA